MTLYPALRLLALFGKDPVDTYRATLRPSQERYLRHYRMRPLQARVGLGMLAQNDRENEGRKKNARLLRSLLEPEALALCLRDDPDHGHYFFILQSEHGRQISEDLLQARIDTGKMVMRNCPKLLGFGGEYPNAEKAFTDTLQIPIDSSLRENDIRFIADAFNKAVRKTP